MQRIQKNFSKIHTIASIFAAFAFGIISVTTPCDAATASRSTRSTTSTRGQPITKNTPVAATKKTGTASQVKTTPAKSQATITATETKTTTPLQVANKASQFDDLMSDDDVYDALVNDDALAKSIREQRDALRAKEISNETTGILNTQQTSMKNECDTQLRACMQQKCGNDFTKCSGDSEGVWGNKMDTCRRNLPCTGEEYKLFATEIKADRDANMELSLYNSIISCGDRYNDCIVSQCGQTFSKCLGKASGDRAIQKCKSIANDCTEADSGLASRAMSVFGSLRSDAEKDVARNEARLHELRDLMRDTCKRLGANFDDRTLDCIYTINFRAGEDNAVQASRKAYAGTTFTCTPDWFGVDVTTYMENAFRLTRAQTSATSAIMGSGIGLGVGAVTSGAIGRSIDTAKAENDLYKKLCDNTKGTWNKTLKKCTCNDGYDFDKEKGCPLTSDFDNVQKSGVLIRDQGANNIQQQQGSPTPGSSNNGETPEGSSDSSDGVEQETPGEATQKALSEHQKKLQSNGTSFRTDVVKNYRHNGMPSTEDNLYNSLEPITLDLAPTPITNRTTPYTPIKMNEELNLPKSILGGQE